MRLMRASISSRTNYTVPPARAVLLVSSPASACETPRLSAADAALEIESACAIAKGQWRFQLRESRDLESSEMMPAISIIVNGETREAVSGVTVRPWLDPLGIRGGRAAIERNLQVLLSAARSETKVPAGDRHEIVHFVGGG
jgi:thiamine biosynthesis protein ThiS